jgi:hypothetical protein
MTLAPATSSTHAAAVGSDMAVSSDVGDVPATPTKNSFRVSVESSGEIFRGSKTPASPIIAAEGAAQLSPSKRDDVCSIVSLHFVDDTILFMEHD